MLSVVNLAKRQESRTRDINGVFHSFYAVAKTSNLKRPPPLLRDISHLQKSPPVCYDAPNNVLRLFHTGTNKCSPYFMQIKSTIIKIFLERIRFLLFSNDAFRGWSFSINFLMASRSGISSFPWVSRIVVPLFALYALSKSDNAQ